MVAALGRTCFGSAYDELEVAHDVVEAVVAVQDKLEAAHDKVEHPVAAHDAVELVSAHEAVGHVLDTVGHVLADL